MKHIFRMIWSVLCALGCLGAAAQSEAPSDMMRKGIVVYPSDIRSLGTERWIDWMKQGRLNLLGIHADTFFEPIDTLQHFLQSDSGRELIQRCRQEGIGVEFELHVLQTLLPRELYDAHPEYFRQDSAGRRIREYNMCFTCEDAYEAMRGPLADMLQWLRPTTHRYYFWTDDVKDAFCQCENCRRYSPSEQALIYENRLLKMLREYDPEAMLAHLAYHNTLPAPERVTPSEGVFLEYAPISRDYSRPLPNDYQADLRKNLRVFPAQTAHVLEYWLDVSMHSDWKKNNLVELPWSESRCRQDAALYQDLGVRSITSFAAWINGDYVARFGRDRIGEILQEYGKALEP